MSQPLAHLYDLALRTLDDQERRADALRGRLGPVLAASALGISLLSGPLGSVPHPSTIAGRVAIGVAVGSLLVVTTTAFRLLADRRQPLDRLDPHTLMIELAVDGALADETEFYATMIVRLQDHLDYSISAIERLRTTFTTMLWGILVMLCGLALAALVG